MSKNDQQFIARKIRAQYLEKEPSELDRLRELDRKVRRPATVFAYLFGSIAAIITGAGMSLVMTDIGAMLGLADTMIPGIVIGVVGLMLAGLTYPIYSAFLGLTKQKYAPEILSLSDKIMNQ